MSQQARVILKARRARPFWFGHPWVFSGAVERVKGRAQDGDLVALLDSKGKKIGDGFFNGRSQIRVRMLGLGEEARDPEALIRERLDRAISLRTETLGLSERSNAFRLVHSDGDGLPGLIVDRLGDHLVLQFSSVGMARHAELVVSRLRATFAGASIIERASRVAREEEGLEREEGVLFGEAPEGPLEVVEDGVRYLVDPLGGQKTGYYSDQRENRLRCATAARGLEVLDAFSYVGGFGMRMAKEGAKSVHLLDSSGPALELAKKAAELNGIADRMSFEEANVLRALDHYRQEGRSFDLIVLDPPKFVFRRKDLERGLRLYHEVNQKALRVLRPGGQLITCSCSQHVLEEHFEEMLASAAKAAGVRFQELYRGGQGADHPILYPLEESRYLKLRHLRTLPGAPADAPTLDEAPSADA